VLAAAVTELLELETASGRLLVLRSRVVPLLALGALQCNNFPHFFASLRVASVQCSVVSDQFFRAGSNLFASLPALFLITDH
jgi:hypothetical protein